MFTIHEERIPFGSFVDAPLLKPIILFQCIHH